MLSSSNISFQIANASNQTVTIQAPIRTNQWVHIAGTLETNGNMRLYTNGVLAAQTNTAIRPLRDLDPVREPSIGIGNHGGTYVRAGFNGMIDEISLYSRALSQAEIQAII